MPTNNHQEPDSKEFRMPPRPELDSSDRETDAKKDRFETKEAFVTWLESELEELEARFPSFATASSFRNYIGR